MRVETVTGNNAQYGLYAECLIAFTVEQGHDSIICTQRNINNWATNNVVYDSEGTVGPDEQVNAAINNEYHDKHQAPILSCRIIGETNPDDLV